MQNITLRMLPGLPLTPVILLHQTLEQFPKAKSIVVSVMDENDGLYTYWSNMDTAELALHAVCIRHYTDKEITVVSQFEIKCD